ncbi:serine/threonine-protein kinase pim-2-like [Labeo rohita]|uniref:serine/threonine-protein kinase pim-2-like n=1 Tax=Labeo rohita TaxID=84645 RepID=UPI0021E1E5CB|nr:serine/threonine-protein kinase pim-2-like [Labeo rohita]
MKSALQAPSLCVGPETTVITVICAHAKINRGWLDRVFLNRGWLDRSSEQTTAPLYERRAEDQISLESIDWSLEDHDLQEPPFSSSLEVLPPEDQQAQSPPAPTYKRKRLESDLEPVGERSDGQERQKRRKSSFEKLPSLHLSDQSSSSGQGQKGEDQTAAAIDESFIIGRKRKQSFLSTPPTSSINVAENHLPIGAEEEPDLPMIKKRRTESLEKLLSLKSIKWSSSDQGTIYERQAKDDILSRYEIGKMLGEGGNGCVYEGKRLEDGLEVAVKFASKSSTMKYISVPGHPAPIPLEIGLLLLVNMESKVPEIIQLLDWQDQPERYIMVLERPSPCKDLWDYALFQGGFLSEDTARVIMAQATKAAYMCCQRGVFHRDIKLENLLINTETLKVKLIDFGCGDLLQDSSYKQFCGTLDYCPPEYFVNHKYHGKPTTVWSLGILLFLMVCGGFPEPKDTELIDCGIWFKDELSDECCHLIRSLLNENPSKRMDLEEILLHDWFMVTKQPRRFLHWPSEKQSFRSRRLRPSV